LVSSAGTLDVVFEIMLLITARSDSAPEEVFDNLTRLAMSVTGFGTAAAVRGCGDLAKRGG
jgi:hypothetical protein